jgi:predicted enzyme related to lactoylglutathione lyase
VRSSARYVHTSLVARDWRLLARFYTRVFGCRIKPPERDLRGPWLDSLTSIRGAHVRGAHLLLPGCAKDGPTLEIFQYARQAGSGPAGSKPPRVDAPGLRHLAFAVGNVNAALARVVLNGGSRVGGSVSTRVEGVGQLDVVYARDPEGNIIEIQKWK